MRDAVVCGGGEESPSLLSSVIGFAGLGALAYLSQAEAGFSRDARAVVVLGLLAHGILAITAALEADRLPRDLDGALVPCENKPLGYPAAQSERQPAAEYRR